MRLLFFSIFIFCQISGADDICRSVNPADRNLSWYEKITYFVLKDSGFGVNEAKFVANNPFAARNVRHYSEFAIGHSLMFCQPKGLLVKPRTYRADSDDNEVDAIRHFLGSAILAYKMPGQALEVLHARELKGQRSLDQSNLMDLKNDQLGVQFGSAYFKAGKEMNLDDFSVLALKKALQLLKEKKLVNLKETITGNCKLLSEKSDKEIESLVMTYQKEYQAIREDCKSKGLNTDSCGMQVSP